MLTIKSDYQNMNELVTGRRTQERLTVIGALQMLAGFACFLAIGAHQWWSVFGVCALGIILVWSSFARLRRARCYYCGWVDGRIELLQAFTEAARRGMTPREWYETERCRIVAAIDGPDFLHDKGNNNDDKEGT